MNKVLLTIIALTLLLSVAGATTDCVTHAPTAYGAYSVVTIDNTQSTATNVSSQQQINLTESSFAPYLVYNNNYANFGYYYQNGTNVTAWIESNVSGKLVTWAKINPSISGISSMDICLGFASTNLLSSSGITGIGEAPQLSSTYAQYDNGANVFPALYQNFAGTSTPSGWQSAGTVAQNNGIGAITPTGYILTNATYGGNASQIFDALISTPASVNPPGYWYVYGYSTEAGVHTTGGEQVAYGITDGYNQWVVYTDPAGTAYAQFPAPTTLQYSTTGIISIYYPDTTGATPSEFYLNYSLDASSSGTTGFQGIPTYIGINNNQGAGQNPATVRWLRVRTYPPSGVMPTVSYGSIILPTTTTIPTTTSTSVSTTTSSVSTTTSSVTTTIPTTTSVSTSTSSVTTTIPTTTSVSTTTSTSVPITFTTTINPRNSTLVNATTACKDLPCVMSYTFAIPEISLIFVFVAFGIAWQVTHKLINGLASALIVAIVMVGIAPTLLNIGVLVVIGFFVVLGYYTHAFERKSD